MDQTQIEAVGRLVALLPQTWVGHVMTYLYAASAILALLRWLLNRYLPPGPLRSWIEAIDLLAHYATASSRALKDRIAPEPHKRTRSFPPLPVLALAFVPLLGCAGTTETRVRGSLDGALQIAELSYGIASDACDQQRTPERCEAIDIAYERIADIGESALQALDAGRLEQAQDMYKQMAALLRGLKR